MEKSAPPTIIPAALDDADLSMGEFRIFAHLTRRVGLKGRCWTGAARIAKHCKMTKKTAIKHLHALEARGAIVRSRKEGVAANISIIPIGQWVSGTEGSDTGVKNTRVENLHLHRSKNYPSTGVKFTPKGVKEGDKDKERGNPCSSSAAFSSPDDLELPFDSPEFVEAWNDWKAHRREQRKKFTPTAARLQLAELKRMGETRALAALRHSTTSGYMGIFEPRDNTRPRPTPQPYDDFRIAKSLF